MLETRTDQPKVLIRGGGDLASGVAISLHRAGFKVIVTELAAPLMVRRAVSFGQAVYDGVCQVEEVTGMVAKTSKVANKLIEDGKIAVIVDPGAEITRDLTFAGIVDGRMIKTGSDQRINMAPIVIGLGPGFTVGVNCHFVIETNRGKNLGRVYRQGSAEPDSGIPEAVNGYSRERVLSSPADGIIVTFKQIGDLVNPGEQIASVSGLPVLAKFRGALRGLIQNGSSVKAGMKIGDLDPRSDVSRCFHVSDKALAIGQGVLEALSNGTPLAIKMKDSD